MRSDTRPGALPAIVALLVIAPAASARTVEVADAAQLLAVLAGAKVPATIRLQPGDYALTSPLVVPDGVTLRGPAPMRLDAKRLPRGPEAAAAVLRVSADFEGDAVTLGDGSRLERLRVVDRPDDPATPEQRVGNAVAVYSRAAGDRVAASISECEIVNPHPFGRTRDGPAGNAIVLLTRNPRATTDDGSHAGSDLRLQLDRVLVRATGRGGGIFANNFATRSAWSLAVARSRIEGTLSLAAGTSRPHAVRDARGAFTSSASLYERPAGGYDRHGWMLLGGSSAHQPKLEAQGASHGTLTVASRGDRVRGYRTAVFAAAARRYLHASGPLNDNRIELDLRGLVLEPAGDAASDLAIDAQYAEPDPERGQEFHVGDRNVVVARLDGVRGTGATGTRYAVATGPREAGNLGQGNAVRVRGAPVGFASRNPGLRPPDPALFEPDR